MGKVLDKLWELESKLPNGVKKHTDRIIVSSSKALRPLREDSKKRGKAWVESQRRKYHV